MNDPIISENKELLWEMAEEDPLGFDLFDKSTWKGVSDYTPIIDVVHKRIAIHPIHQQRCELHVQMAAFVASTNVGEVRRSCRAMCLSTIFRPYHQWALKIYQMKRDEENAKLFAASDKLKKKQVVRVLGSLRIQTLADYANKFTEWAEDIQGQISDEKYEEIYNIVCTAKSKTSTDLKESTKKRYAQGVQKKRKITKSE